MAESGSRKKEAMGDGRNGEGDNEEARGDCESDKGKSMDGDAPACEGIRGGRTTLTVGTKSDEPRTKDAKTGKNTQNSIAESATIALTEDSHETTNKDQRGNEE